MKLHLKAPRPLLYLSGNGSSNMDEQDLIDQGCKYRCFSYAYTCPDALYYQKRMEEALHVCEKNNIGIMMDSSAHSFHQLASKGLRKLAGKYKITDIARLRELVVKQYVGYVKEQGKNWDFYVNFDYVRHCPTIREMQARLEKKGIEPIPVYHGDMELEWLERYCKEGYKLIGIGSVKFYGAYRDKRHYYDKVFDVLEKYGALAHGFAVTSMSLMYMYPFYSVDSATWAKVAAYGSILFADTTRQTIGEVHLTDRVVGGKTRFNLLPKTLQRQIKHQVEDNGFEFEVMREDGRARSLYNVFIFCNKLMELKEMVSATRKRWKSLP